MSKYSPLPEIVGICLSLAALVYVTTCLPITVSQEQCLAEESDDMCQEGE